MWEGEWVPSGVLKTIKICSWATATKSNWMFQMTSRVGVGLQST